MQYALKIKAIRDILAGIKIPPRFFFTVSKLVTTAIVATQVKQMLLSGIFRTT